MRPKHSDLGVHRAVPKVEQAGALIVGLLSLFWLVCRTGRKPSRFAYPCQRAAAGNVGLLLLPLAAFLLPWLTGWRSRLCRGGIAGTLRFVLLIAVIGSTLLASGDRLPLERPNVPAGGLARSAAGPAQALPVAAGGSAFATLPQALAAASPHRVVAVHHAAATAWDFSCTDSGSCPSYYGDDGYVSQSAVDAMVASGLRRLTGTATAVAAWEALLPGYKAGEVVAIKVNFNDSIFGGGTPGYADDDAFVDALPQPVNSIVAGLIARGVARGDIWIFDSSRYITDRFRSRLDYAGVRYFDGYGNGADVEVSTFAAAAAGAVDFSPSGYPGDGQIRLSDVLIAAKYLINIPIMKRHVGAGTTLSLKNHLGSVNGFTSGSHSMHDWFYLDAPNYQAQGNPIVDINGNANIREKTVLIVGDGLYGGKTSNNTPPERWRSFGDDSPNLLFFAIDPVAVDSVMYDYLAREAEPDPAAEDILFVAAAQGLGVHDRWNNGVDREYAVIDYQEIDYDGGADPLTVVGLRAAEVSTTGVVLVWEPSLSLSSEVTGYTVYRDGSVLAAPAVTSFRDGSLIAGRTYRYRITSRDAFGRESELSEELVVRTASPSSDSQHLPFLPLLLDN